MKKLLALVIVGGFLALTTGCPPASTPPKTNPPSPKESTPAKDTPAKDTPAKDTPAKDTPAKDTPAKDTPAKDTPAKDTPAKATTHDGKFVKIDGGKLSMKDKDGKDMSHELAKDVKITVDGTDAKEGDLKADMAITVTIEGDKVTKIAAKK